METHNDARVGASHTGRIDQAWYVPAEGDASSEPLRYRPALLVECLINFRSIKAGISETVDRIYTAWLPGSGVTIDWDTPAIASLDNARLADRPDPAIAPPVVDFGEAVERFDEMEAELLDLLVRRERVVVCYNPIFNLFSDVDERRDDFLARTAEIALQEIEPELKQLQHVFEMQLDQLRQAQGRHDHATGLGEPSVGPEEQAEVERRLMSRTGILDTETHLASLFSGFAGLVLRMPAIQPRAVDSGAAAELREDLARVEQEAAEALNQLYTRYIDMVRSCDEFEIGIQPGNIRVLRRMILWTAQ
jgi:hypothetical protein